MTTTAFDDQYLAAPEPVRQPYSTEAILRRNIADMEVALRTQTELKEKAEAELAKLALRGWEFIKSESDGRIWLHIATPNGKHHAALSAASGVESRTIAAQVIDLLCEAASAPAPAPLTKFQAAITKTYAPILNDDTVPAPAVPAEWRKVMAELLANDGADGSRYDANKWLAARDKARALLQSAEALHD